MIERAIELLRDAGAVVLFKTEETLIYAIMDDLDIRWSEPDGCKIYVDGVDITDTINTLDIHIIPGNFPLVSCKFSPLGDVNINDTDLKDTRLRDSWTPMKIRAKTIKKHIERGE